MAVAANMFFTLGRGFVVEASISLLRLLASVAFLGLPFRGQPWTPPLWQRGFPLVNCLVLRRLLALVRSGVANTFCCVSQANAASNR